MTKAANLVLSANLKRNPPKTDYFGINLEEYVKDVDERAANFGGKVIATEATRRTQEVCQKLCKGIGLNAVECRKEITRLSLQSAQFELLSKKDRQAKLPYMGQRRFGYPELISDDKKKAEFPLVIERDIKKTYTLLNGELSKLYSEKATVRASDPSIADRDPLTGKLYRGPKNDEEKKLLRINSPPSIKN